MAATDDALFHLTVQVIKRSEGRSVVACAAYRAGDRLRDELHDCVHDYTDKGLDQVVWTEVMLPERAPERWLDYEIMWNEVEDTERAGNAQLARETEFAIPNILAPAEQLELTRCFIRHSYVERGMPSHFAIHDKGDGNVHCHTMSPMRACDEEGFLAKTQKHYLMRDAEGREEWANAARSKELAEDGYEKVYTYGSRQLTPSEAEELGLTREDRNSKYPVSEKRDTTDWNRRDLVDDLRREWQDLCNEALERHYEREQVREEERRYTDCRSYAERGIDRIPTRHEGPAGRHIAERGEMTMAQAHNEIARLHNAELERMEASPIPDEAVQRVLADRVIEHGLDAAEQVREVGPEPDLLAEHVSESRGWLERFRMRFDHLRERALEVAGQARDAIERSAAAVREGIESIPARQQARGCIKVFNSAERAYRRGNDAEGERLEQKAAGLYGQLAPAMRTRVDYAMANNGNAVHERVLAGMGIDRGERIEQVEERNRRDELAVMTPLERGRALLDAYVEAEERMTAARHAWEDAEAERIAYGIAVPGEVEAEYEAATDAREEALEALVGAFDDLRAPDARRLEQDVRSTVDDDTARYVSYCIGERWPNGFTNDIVREAREQSSAIARADRGAFPAREADDERTRRDDDDRRW